jgi:hypothetical protein
MRPENGSSPATTEKIKSTQFWFQPFGIFEQLLEPRINDGKTAAQNRRPSSLFEGTLITKKRRQRGHSEFSDNDDTDE